MVRPRVYVTRTIVSPWLDYLRKYCETLLNPDPNAPPRDILLDSVRDKDALLCMLSDKIDSELFDHGSRLAVVGTHSVGFEHIDVDEATKRGIYVTNTPEVLTDATADFAWALLLAAARRVAEGDRVIRKGKWEVGWAPTLFLGAKVSGKTLGIIGLGRIGKGVAERARGFRMKVLYADTVRAEPAIEKRLHVEYVPVEELLRESDFVSLHVPATPGTIHLVNQKTLGLMKPSAILINTSRGAVVESNALVKALTDGLIAGAGLDVFENEPLPLQSALVGLENVVLTPHIASADVDARSKMSEMVVKDIVSVLSGRMPKALINPDVLKVRSLDEVRRIQR